MHYLTTKRLLPTLILAGFIWSGSIPIRGLTEDLLPKISSPDNSVSYFKQERDSNIIARSVKSRKGKIYISPNGQIKVTLPSGWSKATGLNERAELEVSNAPQNMYLIVLSESKADFKKAGQDISLPKHSGITRGILVKNLTKVRTIGPKNLTINGNKALQYEILGVSGNLNIAYLHTTVETANNYHQMIAYTSQAELSKNRSKMKKVINSFQEVK
jgi:hypothetical protein